MWGIIPAAGLGSRIQPLAFSKELLPVGSRRDGDGGQERPRAVSEYLVERLVLAGATKLCFVIAPGKSDILNYYGAAYGPAVAKGSDCPTPAQSQTPTVIAGFTLTPPCGDAGQPGSPTAQAEGRR